MNVNAKNKVSTTHKLSLPGFVVIEGPIGVGKTTLCKRLAATFGGEVVLEQPEQNPFLERFYSSPRAYALPAQLSFLFQRSKMLKNLRQQDMFSQSKIADFLFEKDIIFAQLNLEDDELDLYEQAYQYLLPDIPVPDLVIYLQAPIDTLFERIRRRGIAYEQTIDQLYLKRLTESYSRFFHTYSDCPLLVVNAENLNFVNNEQDYQTLVNEITTIKSGRHYFNPMGASR